MLYPAYSFFCLTEAIILFPASIFTFNKLCQGSKSHFAYLIIAFTLATGLCRLTYFIMYLFPIQKVQEPNGYVYITIYNFYLLLSLQPWIFGMKYLWSGVLCSLQATWLTLDWVKWMGWTGGLCYALFIITCWCVLMATFPGYSDLVKLQEWFENTFHPIYTLSFIIWGVVNTVSTIVTILGI